MTSKTPSYLQPTASTTRRAARAAPAKRAQPHPRHRPPPTAVQAPQSTLDNEITRGDAPSKRPAVESQSAPTTQPSHSHSAEVHTSPPGQTNDSLQIAAQVQSWLFMQSNLQETLSSVRQRVKDSSNALAEAISGDSNLESCTALLEAEKLVVFLDDLAKAGAGTRLPHIVHQFLEHEKSWLQLQADLIHSVAQLPIPSHDDVQKLKACLDEEVSRVTSLLTEVESRNTETCGVDDTLAQLYPVLRARSDNIKIASDVIDYCIDSLDSSKT